jgi:hypothetical protein
MGEYIERETFIKAVKDIPMWGSVAAMIADSIPAADVAPVVHGRWIHFGGDEWGCSACGFVITTEGSWDKPTKKYCEDCGAKMDGAE